MHEFTPLSVYICKDLIEQCTNLTSLPAGKFIRCILYFDIFKSSHFQIITMYFAYFEKGVGELYFQALYNPFGVLLSEKIPELFMVGLN